MTKRLKIFLIALLSTFLTISASVLLFPTSASADEYVATDTATLEGHEKHTQSGAHFKWETGAHVLSEEYYNDGYQEFGEEPYAYGLRFDLQLTDLSHLNLEDGYLNQKGDSISATPQHIWHAADFSMFHKYTFTMHRVVGSGKSVALAEKTLLFFYYGNDFVCAVLERDLSHYQEVVEVKHPEKETNSNTPSEWLNLSSVRNSEVRDMLSSGKYVVSAVYRDPSGLPFSDVKQSDGNVAKMYSVYVFPNSPYSEYFVELKHEYFYAYSATMAWYLFTRDVSISDSVCRSVCGVWQKMDDAGALEDSFSQETIDTYITPVFASMNKQTVTVTYLEDIEGTPFAHKATKTVNVPVISGSINVADVYNELGVDLLPVADTSVYRFEKVGDTLVFDAVYLKNVWLRSITVDGKYYDYFLDINLSYEDYYKPFVESEILSAGAYETIFSQMIGKYPKLSGYEFDEVYGYFGFVFTPQNLSYNSLFKEVFDVETSQSGMTEQYSYDCILSQDAYNKLLNDYQYSWHQIIFSHASNIVTGSVNATAYMFYSVPGTKLAHIGEGGQSGSSDTDGIIGGAIKDVGNWASDVLGGLWHVVAEPLRSEATIRVILGLVLVGVGVYLAFKFGLISIGGGKKRK